MNNNGSGAAGAAAAIVALGILLVELVLVLVIIVGMWKVFTKAGKPGWAAIVPIYNVIVLLEISGKPIWWIILFFIPLVNFVIALLVDLSIAKKFRQGAGFGIGLLFLPFIFFPILGFGSAQYDAAA